MKGARYAYYEELKELARREREKHGLTTPRVLRSDLRRIYGSYGVKIDLWPHRLRNIRGAYFNDDLGPTVMLRKGLPEDPMVFTMAHELKHHLVDRDSGLAYCDTSNEREPIEIGAEVFAAEFIYPEQTFAVDITVIGAGSGHCTAEMIVRLKHETRTTLSYAGLAKRAVWLGFADTRTFANVPWKKLETSLYGVPFFKRRRARRR